MTSSVSLLTSVYVPKELAPGRGSFDYSGRGNNFEVGYPYYHGTASGYYGPFSRGQRAHGSASGWSENGHE